MTTIRSRLLSGLLIVLAVGPLATVADEKQPDRRTCHKAEQSDYDSFLSSLSVKDA